MKGFASGLPDFEDAFCALLWRWALKNVGTCFLQAPRSKKLSIRYVLERERPTEIVMHKRRTVFSRV